MDSKDVTNSRAPPGDVPLTAAQRRALARNLPKSLVLAFFQVFMVFIPIAVPFFQQRGLDMQGVLLLQAWFGAVVVLMEVPSGYIADRFGRKRALVAGTLLLGLGFSVLPFANGFVALAIFEALLGIGVSLISGADLALLCDTELALDRAEGTPGAVRNLHVAHSASEAIAALLCSALMLWSVDAVVAAQVFAGWIPFAIAVTLVEPPVHRALGEDAGERGVRMREVLTHMLGGERVLRYTVLALAFWSLTTFYAVWLLQQYWALGGIALVWFGVLWALCNALSGVAGRFAATAEARLGAPALLLLVGLLPALGYVAMAGMPFVAGLVLALGFFVARGLGLVVLRDALNSRVPSRFRATANSVASFGFRGASVVTAPLVGGVLDASDGAPTLEGMEPALWLLAVGCLLVLRFVLLPLAREIQARTRQV